MRRIALLFAGMVFFGTTPAAAHADFVSMTPAAGSTVSELSVVTLTFSEDITALGSAVVVLDPNGLEIQSGLTVQGAAVSVPVNQPTVAGTYTVNYRVVSVDAHVIEGSQTLVYDGPVDAPTPIAVATVQGGGDDDEGFEGEEGFEASPMIIGLAALLTIALVALVLFGRSRKQ